MILLQISGETILDVWKESIIQLLEQENIVPTDRNLDTYEVPNTVLSVSDPLKDIVKLLAFEKKRNKDYNAPAIRNYWKTVEARLKKFPKTSINQLEEVYNKLNLNPYSRHCYISNWVPSVDIQNTYPMCLVGIQFFVRNDRLNMTAILRSNDSWGQALNDMYEMVMIQEKMAKKLQLEIGTYTHIALSYHLYTKDVLDVNLILKG